MVMMVKITIEDSMIKLISFFGVLLKEYLDYIWWDYHDEMVKLGIREDKGKKINDKCFT